MERIPSGIYTEFREQAVRLHEGGGMTIPEAAKRLSLPGETLKNGVYATRHGKLGEVDKNQKPLTELAMEWARVKRKLAEIKMERDLLKKVTTYLCEGVAVKYGRWTSNALV